MLRIAFRYGDSRLFARAVCWWRGGDSAHCEVLLGDSVLGGGWHECLSSSWLDGGVRVKWMPLPADKWRIYEVPFGSVEEARAWAWKHSGEGYDALGLLGFVIRRVKGLARDWFCSEVAAELMGLRDPWQFDLKLLEAVCARTGKSIQ
jgi:hypothetical protein